MRFAALVLLLLLVVARHASAKTEDPDESAIELGPPPPPPPGARVTGPDEPSSPTPEPTAPAPAPLPPEPAPVVPAPIAPEPAPVTPEPAHIHPEPEPIVLGETEPPSDRRAQLNQRPKAGTWYGWKILIADGGAFTLSMASQPLGTVLGGGAYLLTAPAIHLGHRRGLTALGSLGLRIGAPLVLHAAMGEEPCNGDTCFQPGILLGATIASLVDVIVLAHEPRDTKATKAGGLAPVVAMSRKSAGVGLAGSF